MAANQKIKSISTSVKAHINHMVSVLLLAFVVFILILPQGNVTCYLEGVVV